MKLLYFSSLLLLVSSCNVTRLHYVGDSFPASRHVDVFVDPGSIVKPYSVVGKGFVGHSDWGNDKYIDKIQPLALSKAKQKGADAILIQDDYTVAATSVASTLLRTDSTGRGRAVVGSTRIEPATQQRFVVLFLKYKD